MRIDDLLLLNIFAVFAVSVNALLIFLIIFKSPKSLGSYKYLMVYIAAFELTYAVLYVAEKPDVFTKLSAFFIIVNRQKSYFPLVVSTLFDLLFVGFYGISLALLAIHFIYRFLAVTDGRLLETFQNWKLLLWLAFPILNGGFWMFVGGVIFKANEDSDGFLKEHYQALKESNTAVIEDLYYMGPFYYPKDRNGKEYINLRAFGGSVVLLMLIALSFLTMFLFGYKCFHSLRLLLLETSQSAKFRSIQSQLFRALVFQTLIPVFLMHVPASAIYVTIFFNSSSEIVGQVLGLTIAMYPALNPLPTIFIVKNYRNALKDSIRCILCRSSSTVSDYQTSSSNTQTMATVNQQNLTSHQAMNIVN